MEEALAVLRGRIKAVNSDPEAAYKITEAVAFEAFLRDQERVQAAEVGIRLERNAEAQSTVSAKEHAAELAFLKQLRGKTTVLHIQLYEDWMRARSHRDLS